MKDLVATAIDSGRFPTLARLLARTVVAELLGSEGFYTVLAPTEDAFSRIPSFNLSLLTADSERLTSIMKYHIIPGKYMSSDILMTVRPRGESDIKTLQGARVRFTQNGFLKVNDASVIAMDIEASNGVIHVIDRLILPEKL